MMKSIYSLVFFLGIILNATAQLSIINESNAPDSSAMVEVNSKEKGLLIPRMTSQQRDDILNPAAGLMVYNTDSKSIEFFDNNGWVNVNASIAKNMPCGQMLITHDGLTYGTVMHNGRCWLDRNLGAVKVADSVADSLSYGHYYQWGRNTDGHQLSTSDTTSVKASSIDPGHSDFIITPTEPYDWLITANNTLWNDSSDFLNNPCPQGWKVPDLSEWAGALMEWDNIYDAYNSPLKFTRGGYRDYRDGTLESIAFHASYWTNQSHEDKSMNVAFFNDDKSIYLNDNRAFGRMVRCIRIDDIDTPIASLYGGPQYDVAYSMAMDDQGDFVFAGYTQNFDAQGNDYFFLKTDHDGNMEWAKTYGFNDWDHARAVLPTIDGGYILNGTAERGSTYNDQMYFLKTDANGVMEWHHSYGNTADEKGYDVIQADDNGFILLGTTESWGAGGMDVYIAKTDVNGDEEWGYAVGTDQDDTGYSLIKTPDGGFACVGYQCCEGGLGDWDVKFLKFDADANVEIPLIFGGTGTDGGNDLVMSHDGGYVIAGYTDSFGSGGLDFYIKKLDNIGSGVWSYTYGGTADDMARSIIRTSDNGFAILGYTKSFGGLWNTDMWLVKIDVNGLFEWSFAYGIDGFEEGYSLIQDDAGHFFATGFGFSPHYGAGQRDVILIEFLPDGSACVGEYIGSSSVSDKSGAISHAFPVSKEEVVITEVFDDIKRIKVNIQKITLQEQAAQRSVRGDVAPEVDVICR